MSAIRTQSLTIGYAHGRRTPTVVASALDLQLQQGELVCLLGPNGTGKSTLMRTIAGMQPSLGGSIHLSESPLEQLDPCERARKLSIVLTDRIDVGHLSSYALVSLGRYPHTDWSGRLTDEDHQAVIRAISAVGAEELADRPVTELSDGERQKMMIARALAQDTDIILLDEPTAFLDLARRVEIVALLRNLAHRESKAILLSTHDLEIAVRNADRIWLMNQGGVQTGVSESLVLNRTFESAFVRDGIEFDKTLGAFRPSHDAERRICFSASGLEADWTTRALERVGFEVVAENASTDLVLEMTLDEEGTVWTLVSDERRPFTSLDDLIPYLQRNVLDRSARSDV